jgi:hypothetical protein
MLPSFQALMMPQDTPMKKVGGIDAQSRDKLLQNGKKFRTFALSR